MANLSFQFDGRTVLVTGAAQGIGYAIAELFLAAGAQLIAADSSGPRLEQAWAQDSSVRLVELDVANSAKVAQAMAEVEERWGGVDILVNNAGITRDGVLWKMSDEDWSAVLGVHLNGTFHLSRALVPGMRARGFGRVVNVTSYTGMHGNFGQTNYAAAKAGIIGFTKALAKEVARFGITVNAISPNASTPMVAAVPPAKLAEMTATIPQGRFAEPAEMAAGVAFLASEEASYITGTVLAIDGGLSM